METEIKTVSLVCDLSSGDKKQKKSKVLYNSTIVLKHFHGTHQHFTVLPNTPWSLLHDVKNRMGVTSKNKLSTVMEKCIKHE